MNHADQLMALRSRTGDLLDRALGDIRDARSDRGSSDAPSQVAEYLLKEAREYLDGAWEMLLGRKPRASLALSRWLLEAALNLLWVVADQREVEARLASLRADALRLAALQHEGMAEVVPSQARARRALAKEARRLVCEENAASLKPLAHRVDEAKESFGDETPSIYPLFRACSAAAHPNLAPLALPTPRVRVQYLEDLAIWMAAAPTLYLVAGASALVGVGDAVSLKRWWTEEVAPLLPT